MTVKSCGALIALTLLFASSCTVVTVPGERAPRPERTPPPITAEPPRRPPPAEPPADVRPTRGGITEAGAGEIRALWVVRTSLTHPDSARAMVHRAAEAGFNTVIVQVRGRGDAYYGSRWEPRAAPLAAHGSDFDPLAVVLHEARPLGIRVHAWVNTHLVASAGALPVDPHHVVVRRPDLLAVPRELARELHSMDPWDPRYLDALTRYTLRNADRVEGLYTSPASPEVKEHVYSVWIDLLDRYDLDGIHFDYVRYGSPDYDYSQDTLERFRRWMAPRLSGERIADLDRSLVRDPLAYVDAHPDEWSEFRRAQITELVERIYWGVKKRSPRVVVSAAVMADGRDAFQNRFQDWVGWLRMGIVDIVAPMAYTDSDDVFARQIRAAVDAAGDGSRVWAGIGVYRNTFAGSVSKIGVARAEGAGGIVLFSYDWTVQREGVAAAGGAYLPRVRDEAFGVGDASGVVPVQRR
jgi:uncharacterized lipoprotein YddW (UPF0748 family)